MQVLAMQEELQQQAQERHQLVQAQQQLASQVQEAGEQMQQQHHLASLLLPGSSSPGASRTTGLTGMAVKVGDLGALRVVQATRNAIGGIELVHAMGFMLATQMMHSCLTPWSNNVSL
jgi:hypothetical protein